MQANFHSENAYSFILIIKEFFVVVLKSPQDDNKNKMPGDLLISLQPLTIYIPQMQIPKIYIEIGGIVHDRLIILQTNDEILAIQSLQNLNTRVN